MNNKWHLTHFFSLQPPTQDRCLSRSQTQLPIKYFDASNLIAFLWWIMTKQSVYWTIKVKVYEKLIGNKSAMGSSFLWLSRELTDGDPYHEVASSMLIYPADQDTAHPLVKWHLPPDRRQYRYVDLWFTGNHWAAYRAEVKELWGYPNSSPDIDFKRNGILVVVSNAESSNINFVIIGILIGVSVTTLGRLSFIFNVKRCVNTGNRRYTYIKWR